MSGQLVVDKSVSVEPSAPGGLAIFCFIVGAPHIYGRIQSHHCHPQTRRALMCPRRVLFLNGLAGILVAILLFAVLH